MITTSKDRLLASACIVLVEYWIRPMPADIVESEYLLLSVLDQKEIKAGHFKAKIASNLLQPKSMRSQKPMFRKDSSALELVEARLGVPGCRKVAFQDRLGMTTAVCLKAIAGLCEDGCRHECASMNA